MLFIHSAEDKPVVKKTKLNNGAATSNTASKAQDTALPMSERFAGYSFKVNEVSVPWSFKTTSVLTLSFQPPKDRPVRIYCDGK